MDPKVYIVTGFRRSPLLEFIKSPRLPLPTSLSSFLPFVATLVVNPTFAHTKTSPVSNSPFVALLMLSYSPLSSFKCFLSPPLQSLQNVLPFHHQVPSPVQFSLYLVILTHCTVPQHMAEETREEGRGERAERGGKGKEIYVSLSKCGFRCVTRPPSPFLLFVSAPSSARHLSAFCTYRCLFLRAGFPGRRRRPQYCVLALPESF